MKKTLPTNLEKLRIPHPIGGIPPKGSIEGMFMIPYCDQKLTVMSGCGMGWDHVSVSLQNRTPTWEEMCFVKNLFWERDELVLQFHPPEKDYKNFHPYVLHLWKPWDQKIKLPPKAMI